MFHASPTPTVSSFNVESGDGSRNPLSTGTDPDIEEKLTPVSSFHIQFNNLGTKFCFNEYSYSVSGLVLKNGTRIMEGVCGEFKVCVSLWNVPVFC